MSELSTNNIFHATEAMNTEMCENMNENERERKRTKMDN